MNNVNKKFNPEKLKKLNNTERLIDIPPGYIWEFLSMKNPETLIDIGAGTGLFDVPFLKLMKKGKVYACDISDVMINWMKENLILQYPDIIPVQMSETQVPLNDSIADLVYMITLHHELDEPVKTLAEAYRLLKEGGKVCIIDWKKSDFPFGPPQNIRLTTSEVREQLQQAGFVNISSDDSLSRHFLISAEK